LIALNHLRTTLGKVYAFMQQVRIFFQKNWRHARRVPIERQFQLAAATGRKTRLPRVTSRLRNRDQEHVH
jgi:hypothetical protein